MTKRETLLANIRVEAYHGRSAARFYVRGVSYEAFKAAVQEGRKMKANGVPCSCVECKTP